MSRFVYFFKTLGYRTRSKELTLGYVGRTEKSALAYGDVAPLDPPLLMEFYKKTKYGNGTLLRFSQPFFFKCIFFIVTSHEICLKSVWPLSSTLLWLRAQSCVYVIMSMLKIVMDYI